MSQARQRSLPYLPLTDTISMVPVAHSVQAYADELRRAVSIVAPDCLTLELPRTLTPWIRELVAALPEIRLLAWKTPGGRGQMIPGDPCDSLIEGVRLCQEHGLRMELIDVTEAAEREDYRLLPDDYAVTKLGLATYAEKCLSTLPDRPISDRERIMAARLRILAERHQRVLFVGGMWHYRNLRQLLTEPEVHTNPQWNEPEPIVKILPIHERQLGKVLLEIPYAAYLYDIFRTASGPEERFPMLEALQTILEQTAEQYSQEYDEQVNLTEWRALYQYGRNLALVRDNLRPRLLELLTAAKGCVDDDFGAICLEQAVSYPPNADSHNPWEQNDENEEESPQGRRHESLHVYCDLGEGVERLCHAYPFPDLMELEFHFRRRRPSEEEKQRWREAFAMGLFLGDGICSYPPEDEFIEKFFRTIRQRAFMQISEYHTTSEEFTSSILDGLDVRETMRHWHEKKLYVKRERIPPGRVGPVVLIWKDLPLSTRHLWRTCLYAEHQNESDIAIYGQRLGEEMVGPGITRTEYFGILSIFPAAHIPDVWRIESLQHWRTSPRLLLAAAILLSEERYIAYVAAHPPDTELRMFARENERAIIYLPLATFSKTLLKRARQCHILSGKRVRQWAGDYIPEV